MLAYAVRSQSFLAYSEDEYLSVIDCIFATRGCNSCEHVERSLYS